MADAIRAIGVLGALLLCAASATPYQDKGFRGGVSQRSLGGRSWSITAEGNGYTKRSTLVECCYRRAGELCPGGFQVVDKDANTQQYGNFD